MSTAELNRVTLEPSPSSGGSEDEYTDDEPENEVTDEEFDADRGYIVDAIKWARWRSPGERSDDTTGWHYGLLWKGYLKAASESEEPLGSITKPPRPADDIVRQFWLSFDTEQYPYLALHGKSRQPKKPPPERIKDVFPTPAHRMKKWLSKCMGRDYRIYAGRQIWERDHPGQTVPKRWSDYHVHHRRILEQKNKAFADRMRGVKRSSSRQTESGNRRKKAQESSSSTSSATFGDDNQTSNHTALENRTTSGDSPGVVKKRKKNVIRITSPPPRLTGESPTEKPPPIPAASASASSAAFAPWLSSAQIPPKPSGPRLGNFGKIPKRVESPLDRDTQLSLPASKVPTVSVQEPTPQKGDTFQPLNGIFPSSPTPSHTIVPEISRTSLTSNEIKAEPQSTGTITMQPAIQRQGPLFLPDDESVKDEMDVDRSESVPLPLSAIPTSSATTKDTARAPTPAVSSPQTQPSPQPPSSLPIGASAPTVGQPSIPESSIKSPPKPRMRDLASIPKYQQPKLIKVIDDPIKPIQQRGVPPTPTSSLARSSYPQQGIASGSHTMRSPLDPRSGVTRESGGRTPPGQPSTGSYIPRSTFPTNAHHAPLPPSQPRNFRPPPSGPSSKPVQSYNQNRVPPTGPAAMQLQGPLAIMSPPLPQAATMPAIIAPTYNARVDPRRRLIGTPASADTETTEPVTPISNPDDTSKSFAQKTPQSPDQQNRKVSTLSVLATRDPLLDLRIRVPIRHPVDLTALDVKLLEGARLCANSAVVDSLKIVETTRSELLLEEIDDVCIEGSVKCGARVIEWARVGLIDTEGQNGRSDWETLKSKTKSGKAYVTYTDVSKSRVSAHVAIVFASPHSIDLSHIGLGSWKAEEVSLVCVIMMLPLSSPEPPLLPNPVRPTFEIFDTKPHVPPRDAPLVGSFGLTDEFMGTLSNRRVLRYPGEERPIDYLQPAFVAECKRVGALSEQPPEIVVTCNMKITKTLRSTTLRDAIRRRTAFYTAGPALQLYPSQWRLKRIWEAGGLVTFSPTFILRSPDKFIEIMKMVRVAQAWAAYVLPNVIEWAEMSWKEPARCPDPTKSFEALTKALFLDQNLLQFSGSAASSGGGLAVTCAPPIAHQTEACFRWTNWLRKISEQNEFRSLVDLCQGFQRDFTDEAKPSPELELMDIETAQIEDLTNLRARPHLLPYRRYMYVGELSLDSKTRDRLGAMIEFVDADNFAAIFSGAV